MWRYYLHLKLSPRAHKEINSINSLNEKIVICCESFCVLRYHYDDDGRRYVFGLNDQKIIDPHYNGKPWLRDDHGRPYIYDNLGQRYVLDDKSNRCYDPHFRGLYVIGTTCI